MAGKKKHPNFIEYTNFIAEHPVYSGMPKPYKDDGEVRWVTSGNSKLGKKRRDWWKKKAKEEEIETKGQWISKTARKIHPTGKKPCHVCGNDMKIDYMYPNKTTIKQLNSISNLDIEFNFKDFKEVSEIINEVYKTKGKEGLSDISNIFDITDSIEANIENYINYIIENCGKDGSGKLKLSPGVMSNAPDRFDGFHSYNKCCRKKEDTGRHKENMSRYNEDRRAYENWAEGDWKASSSLMGRGSEGVCAICGNEGPIVADHVGPISLGFAHRPSFQPLCHSCNSAKNNRMFLKDVKLLIKAEENGEKVVSFQAKPLWDKLKHKVKNNNDAKKLSKLLRINQHHFLELLFQIFKSGYPDFLLNFLSPNYAFYTPPEFINLDSSTFEYDSIKKEKGNIKNYQSNASRYLFISFESLNAYHQKENRNWKLIKNKSFNFDDKSSEVIEILENDTNYNEPLRKLLLEILKKDQRNIDKMKSVLKMNKKNPSENKQALRKIEKFFEDLSKELSKKFN